MEARAVLRTVRISPRKVSIVLDLIRGKSVKEALAILQYTPKAASPILTKLIKSAVANAVETKELDEKYLYLISCHVAPGPVMKRMMPRARGGASRILKRTSHITVVVDEKYAAETEKPLSKYGKLAKKDEKPVNAQKAEAAQVKEAE